MRIRWKITSGKETVALGSSPDRIQATNLAAHYAMMYLEEYKTLTVKFEKVEEPNNDR